ncbi:MAG: zinc ribbon domain-containing protein [Gemmatimonadetes bacterium]|nr:zinc ribbon domain-containing protein [Gemmatimonadota bacterium]NNK47414.1 zinc ribbon domain-containing protein [Gemmatimonadota bacterium]
MPAEIPISVAELHRRLLPYPLCRDRLEFASKGEYDMGFLRLLVDEASLDIPEAALREAATKELGSPEPGLAILQRFAASEVRLRVVATNAPAGGAREADTTRQSETGPPIAALETGRSRGDFLPGLDDPLLVPQDESADALGRARGDVEQSAGSAGGSTRDKVSGTPCRSCHQALPERSGVRFCPHCGADQERWPCPACGEEVEQGWSYCALCGKMLPT